MAKDAAPAAETKTAAPAAPAKRVRKRSESDVERVLGVRFLSRIDPDEDFSDVDGDPRNEFALTNEESDRHPMWISPEQASEYKGGVVPYRVEYHREGGPEALMNSEMKAGEPITKRGLVLMTCDKAKWQKKNRYDFKKQQETNARMFKRRQRDLDLRVLTEDAAEEDREAFRNERAGVRQEMRS